MDSGMTAPKQAKPQPKPKTRWCRRPYCAVTFTGPDASLDRDKHEATPTPLHEKHGMDFLCDWEGHVEAITTAGVCPVCQ